MDKLQRSRNVDSYINTCTSYRTYISIVSQISVYVLFPIYFIFFLFPSDRVLLTALESGGPDVSVVVFLLTGACFVRVWANF